jgi:hypothetical protein
LPCGASSEKHERQEAADEGGGGMCGSAGEMLSAEPDERNVVAFELMVVEVV